MDIEVGPTTCLSALQILPLDGEAKVRGPCPEHVRQRLREINLGKKLAPETVEKIRQANTGKKKTKDDRRGISERMMGNQRMLGRNHSEETRKRMSASARRGPASNFWKGGTTEEAKLIRQSAEYRLWRKAVFERDNYTCQLCGERGGRLHPDHIKRFSDYPELRLELSNGRTLCESCHKQTPNYGRRRTTNGQDVGVSTVEK